VRLYRLLAGGTGADLEGGGGGLLLTGLDAVAGQAQGLDVVVLVCAAGADGDDVVDSDGGGRVPGAAPHTGRAPLGVDLAA